LLVQYFRGRIAAAPSDDTRRRREEMLRTLQSIPEVWEEGQQRISFSFIAEPEDLTAAMEILYQEVDDDLIRAEVRFTKSKFSLKTYIEKISDEKVDAEKSRTLSGRLKQFKDRLFDRFFRRG
jgi:hypothetical protein